MIQNFRTKEKCNQSKLCSILQSNIFRQKNVVTPVLSIAASLNLELMNHLESFQIEKISRGREKDGLRNKFESASIKSSF